MKFARLRRRLALLEARWLAETDPVIQYGLAKLYCLECCGWLELWLDDFYGKSSSKYIVTSKLSEKFKAKVDGTYGFAFEKNVEPLIVSLGGLAGACKLQRRMNPSTFEQMKASLGNLKTWRDKLAHTDAEGVQMSAPAPSATWAEFRRAALGLMAYKRIFRQVMI